MCEDISAPETWRIPFTIPPMVPPTIGTLAINFSGASATADPIPAIFALANNLATSMLLSTVSITRPNIGIPENILANPSLYIDATVLDIIPPPDRTTAMLCTKARICHTKNAMSINPKTSDHMTIQPCLIFLMIL
ncbi:hypothetical protein ANAPC5_01061 [Anaplasma phagocytophilum]|nr:hypothetical protein ANAPC2_00834 [Anaplasma phagocytophilum]SBO32076.1 hypothetical protein ANAPC3_00740 [Anaplasma phagocytophilum]SBO32376.1 hypothetical protein ANAPC4_00788 [Anaplasma phagocytophilum]SCV65129.1 hypothetical protein ANAPC5_01061 [Anaplasma phagocytophilum]